MRVRGNVKDHLGRVVFLAKADAYLGFGRDEEFVLNT
jgi:hypothetical protein